VSDALIMETLCLRDLLRSLRDGSLSVTRSEAVEAIQLCEEVSALLHGVVRPTPPLQEVSASASLIPAVQKAAPTNLTAPETTMLATYVSLPITSVWRDDALALVPAATMQLIPVRVKEEEWRKRAAAWVLLAFIYLMWRMMGAKDGPATDKATKTAASAIGLETTALSVDKKSRGVESAAPMRQLTLVKAKAVVKPEGLSFEAGFAFFATDIEFVSAQMRADWFALRLIDADGCPTREAVREAERLSADTEREAAIFQAGEASAA